MIKKQNHIYIGLDIHKETHTAVISNCFDETLGSITIENKVCSYIRLVNKVKKLQGDLTPIFGLEDVHSHGRDLAIYLQGKGYIVKEVNSALSHMKRMSYPTTKKSDDWDAKCVASVLITNVDELPEANPQDYFWTIKMIVNRRSSLIKTSKTLLNQLHGQLTYSYPSYKKFFCDISGKTALAFFERYPSPSYLEGVEEEELAAFLREESHNSCSTNKAKLIIDFIDEDGKVEKEYEKERDFVIQSLIREIRFNNEEKIKVEEQMKNMLKELDCKLETIPGVDTITAASLIAIIGDVHRFENVNRLAKFAGLAPVNFSSAGKGKDRKSKQGNRDLYSTLYFLAVQQIQVSKKGLPRNPTFLAYYERKVSEGKTKVQALLCVMRRLSNIIYGMMKNNTEYKMPLIEESNK
ncbi:IS110 family RNA-guided transposase [Clostridium felsineum]|uniref:IS110 family transposase n=1 Tax=Clostridium felsineum TaxID=36839 RepID=UPI00098CBF8E|nr:IS110 family transposase [Clostridium felsineum]URZ03820.1 IS110 family transposase ISCth6 [Clostridium felsineum]